MKAEGQSYKIISLKEAVSSKLKLPVELSLWGDYKNFEKLNYDHRKIKIFLVYYYQDIVAGVTFYEKIYLKLLKVGSSPHTNIEVQFGHVYFKAQDSQRANEQLRDYFVEMLTEYLKKQYYAYFYLSLPPEFIDVRAFKQQGWKVTPKFTYILNLENIRKKGLSEFVGKKLRNIIKYVKLDLKVKKIGYQDFFDCYEDTYSRQGKAVPHSKELFKALSELPNVVTKGAFSGRKIAAAVMFCEFGSTSYYITSGVKEEFHKSNGTTLLIYDYLEELLKKKDISYVDLFGANTKKVAYFKSCFDPDLELYFTVIYKPFMKYV